jgi:hypothetical protein
MAQLGATDPEIADFLGVTRQTMHNWKLVHPEFADALRLGKAPADERVIRSLYQRAIGFHYTEQKAVKIKVGPDEERIELVEIEHYVPGDTAACGLWLRNRCPTGWGDLVDIEVGSPDSGDVYARITVDRTMLRLLDDTC